MSACYPFDHWGRARGRSASHPRKDRTLIRRKRRFGFRSIFFEVYRENLIGLSIRRNGWNSIRPSGKHFVMLFYTILKITLSLQPNNSLILFKKWCYKTSGDAVWIVLAGGSNRRVLIEDLLSYLAGKLAICNTGRA